MHWNEHRALSRVNTQLYLFKKRVYKHFLAFASAISLSLNGCIFFCSFYLRVFPENWFQNVTKCEVLCLDHLSSLHSQPNQYPKWKSNCVFRMDEISQKMNEFHLKSSNKFAMFEMLNYFHINCILYLWHFGQFIPLVYETIKYWINEFFFDSYVIT